MQQKEQNPCLEHKKKEERNELNPAEYWKFTGVGRSILL